MVNGDEGSIDERTAKVTFVHPRRAYGRISMAFTSTVSVIMRCMLESERFQRLVKKSLVTN